MTELVTDGQERKKRDERRGQLIGAAWLVRWNSEGRGRGSTDAGSWIRTGIAPREAPEYEWIWIEPYLTTEAGGDIDTYRGQQAGRALVAQFAREVNAAAVYWFAEAKQVAEATQEEWLFLTGIMYTDGWVERDGTDSKGNTFIAWTMAPG